MSGAEHGHGHKSGPKKSTRRIFFELSMKSALGLFGLDLVNHLGYGFAQARDLSARLKYERDHKLPFEALSSYLTGYKIGYPIVPEGWGFERLDGPNALPTDLSEELAVATQYPELKFYLRGAQRSPVFPGMFVSSYLDSSNRLVPKIFYWSSMMTPAEYVLTGHLSQPEGSFSNRRPDIIRIFNEYSPGAPTYYASLIVGESGFLNRSRLIHVTPLRMVELPKTQGS